MRRAHRAGEELDPSPAMCDPWKHLACAICAQAVRDLTGNDPVKAVDALIWFTCEGAGDLLAYGGFEGIDPLDWLRAGVKRPMYRDRRKNGDKGRP